MSDTLTRFDTRDLRAYVDILTLPSQERVPQAFGKTKVTRSIELPPLLTQLEDAIRSTMNPGKTAGSRMSSQMIPLDSDALYRFALISNAIQDWCRLAGIDRKHPVDGLRAWHAVTLAWTGYDPTWHVEQLRGWVSLIRSKVDPPRTLELTITCPTCTAGVWVNADGDTVPHPLVVQYRPDGVGSILTHATARCRACAAEWRGEMALRSLRWGTEEGEQS